MANKFFVVIVTGLLIAACGSKTKKPEGPETGGAGAGGDPITTVPMNFDPSGSDSGKIAGLSTIFFPYDSTTLNSDARQTLQTNAQWIKDNPNVVVQVEGHCDGRGSIEYNLALGERRAKAVITYLNTLGVESKRLTVVSFGEEKPVASGDSEEVYAKNRRANFMPISR